jgi:hypothetical protein
MRRGGGAWNGGTWNGGTGTRTWRWTAWAIALGVLLLSRSGFAACAPVSCAFMGLDCGYASDGCANVLWCGDCVLPQYCGGAGPDHCGGVAGAGGPDASPPDGSGVPMFDAQVDVASSDATVEASTQVDVASSDATVEASESSGATADAASNADAGSHEDANVTSATTGGGGDGCGGCTVPRDSPARGSAGAAAIFVLAFGAIHRRVRLRAGR